jgi:hypothetical protein
MLLVRYLFWNQFQEPALRWSGHARGYQLRLHCVTKVYKKVCSQHRLFLKDSTSQQISRVSAILCLASGLRYMPLG